MIDAVKPDVSDEMVEAAVEVLTSMDVALVDLIPVDRTAWVRQALSAALAAQGQEPVAVKAIKTTNYNDGLLVEVIGDVTTYRDLGPEEDESWESWYYAAFDMLIPRIRETFDRNRSALTAPAQPVGVPEDLLTYYVRQIGWSRETFGPALRTKGVIGHIRKELREVEANPFDLTEWVDVVILAMDGFWRHGGKPEQLFETLLAKQKKNMARDWPDWRTMSEDQAIEHDRSKDAAPQPPAEGGWKPMEQIGNLLRQHIEAGESHGGRYDSEWLDRVDDVLADLRTHLAAPANGGEQNG